MLVAAGVFASQAFASLVDAGTVLDGGLSTVNLDTSYVYNGRHEGVVCDTGIGCSVGESITLPTGSYTSDSNIVLSGWKFEGNSTTGDTTERMKAVLTKKAYNATTGVFEWETALAFDQGSSTTFRFDYDFAIILTNHTSVAMQQVTNSCTSTGASCSHQITVTGANPTLVNGTTTLLGFAVNGFDVQTTSSNKNTLGELKVDVATIGTVVGQPTSKKQTLNCTYGVYDALYNEEPISCDVSTVAFATTSGSGRYVLGGAGNYSFSYSAQSNSSLKTPADPSIPTGDSILGLFTALTYFDLTYAVDPLPNATRVRAGCFGTTYNAGATYTMLGLLQQGTAGSPPDNFDGILTCMDGYGVLGN